jgi:hypothetical protein
MIQRDTFFGTQTQNRSGSSDPNKSVIKHTPTITPQHRLMKSLFSRARKNSFEQQIKPLAASADVARFSEHINLFLLSPGRNGQYEGVLQLLRNQKLESVNKHLHDNFLHLLHRARRQFPNLFH